MSTYYEELQRRLDDYKKSLDLAFLELRALYVSRRSWSEDNYKKEEERIKENINTLVDDIDENKDLLATYTLVSNYTEDIKALTAMYNDETNIKLKDEISNELLNKREFINNRLNSLPEDLSKELRKFYLESTSNIEDSKIKELENKKTKLLEIVNRAKDATNNSKKAMIDIFDEERFVIENEGPFKTEKELDDFYLKYMNKKIEENKRLQNLKKKQELLEKKLRILDTRINDRREAVSTANKININPDDYEKILTRIKKRDYVTSLFESLGLNELSNLRRKAIYPSKEELEKYREIIKERLIEEKINQRKRSTVKALPAETVVKEVEKPLPTNNKINHLMVIDKLKEGLNTKPALDRKIATNLEVNKEFKEELHNKENLYNVIHVVPKVEKVPSQVVRKLSSNIINRDSAKDKLKVVKERLDNLSERELMVLYRQYGKHNESERFNTGINLLIQERITKFVNDKEKEISRELDNKYLEVLNCVKELDSINILEHDKNISTEEKEELERYKNHLIHGKANTVNRIRKDYEDAKVLFSNGSTTINNNIRNRFLKNHDLDVEVLDKENKIKRAELQAIKDGNDEMALRCFVEREKLLSKNINKETGISTNRTANKNYYSPLAERLDYKNDSIIREIYKTIVQTSANLNTMHLLDNNDYYDNTKKELLEITNNYASGKITGSEVVKQIDSLNENIKENIKLVEEETIKKLEEYSATNEKFDVDKAINIFNNINDNPNYLSSKNAKERITNKDLKFIYSIPEDIRSNMINVSTSQVLTNSINNKLNDRENKMKNITKLDNILNNYLEYQVNENNNKTR